MTAPPGGWARCTFDGRPLSPGDRRAVRDFAATLDARKADRTVHWRELVEGTAAGPYWREWHCPQPPLRKSWRVLHEEWSEHAGGIPVRRIYAIELAP